MKRRIKEKGVRIKSGPIEHNPHEDQISGRRSPDNSSAEKKIPRDSPYEARRGKDTENSPAKV